MHCPNYANCQLVFMTGFVRPESLRELYIQNYCTALQENWKQCKRYQTSSILHFCPDFVFPDTVLTLNEIMEKFDEETSGTNDLK